MEEEIENIEKGQTDYSMFLLILMSHGNEGVIVNADSTTTKLTDIYKILTKSEKLKGRPKLVIVQACSGKGN